MNINVSKYNEISINEVKRLIADGVINCQAHIEQGDHYACAFAGLVTIANETYKLYAGDVIVANNVKLYVAAEDDSYFDSLISIN